MLTILHSQYQRAKTWYARYERLLMPAMLVTGFIVDYITFSSIQIQTALLVLLFHFLLVGAAIAFLHAYDAGRVSHGLRMLRLFAPLAVQFSFGALLGAAFIFYWFSGSFSASWPLMIIIAALAVGNDVFQRYFAKPSVHIGVYAFTSLSFFLVALTFIVNSLAAWVFLAAGVLALVCMHAYIVILSWLSPAIRERAKSLARVVWVVLVAMHALYFANVIPPIPLAIREAGVYHTIRRSGGAYLLQGERETLFARMIPGQTVHLAPGERTYVYSAIFAPADLRTAIFHHWQKYDAVSQSWVEMDRLSFNLTGGRAKGYRGYSVKTNLEPGKWRVSVETARGQVMGRVRFTVKIVNEPPALEELVR